MDFFAILLISIIAFVGGVACTLLIEFYIFERYLKSGPIAAPPPRKPIPHGKAQLPDELLTKIKQEKSGFGSHGSSGDENLAINLALQFLFNELRNSERVRLWLFKKLNNEFKEFVDQTITGKLFESIRLRDIHLGKNFPMIKGMEVADAKICADTGLLETLDLALDLHYSGNFQLSIDVELLSKTAFLALQVKRVTGKARLQFTRVPYTHWSLSFYSEPILELEVQSQFHGRQLQSQVINIIVNQIRKAVRRKHTLPHYKMRYKPFFRRLNDEDVDLSEVASTQLTPGTLDVTLLELSRLNVELNGNSTKDKSQIEIYCTMSIDYTPWVYITQYGGIPYMVLDLIISKTSSQNFGVVFKREFVLEMSQHCVIVETIVSGSPAAAAEMKRGDIIVAVNGKKVTGLTQVAKLIKSATQRRFIVRVERKYSKTDSERSSKQDLDRISDKDFDRKSSKSDVTIFSKESDSTDSGNVSMERSRFEGIKFSDLKEPELDLAPERESGYKLFRRKSSARTTEDLAHSPDNTPTRKISTSSSLSNTSTGMFVNMDESMNSVAELFTITSEKSLAAVITFDEAKSFKVESELQYLNVGVWARRDDQPPRLVGYINAPIKFILAQCSTTSTGNYLKCQALLPPDTVSTSNASKFHGYSGFDPILCYGDILLSYTWSSSNSVQPVVDNSNNAGNNAKKGSEDSIKVQPISLGVESNDKKLHDFMRTHFHRATQCDFCSKKIWLKDAVQCRDCGMVCHKKCENRCQMLNYCSADSLTTLACEADEVETLVTGDSGPEISLTSCEENVQGASMMAVKASIANTLLGLKKAGSTSCLAPPNAGMGLASRSLPPSPCASRKSSLVGGLGISNELLEGADPSLVAPLLAGELSDGLMSKAKDTGKYLFNHLEKEERIEKINSMIMKLNSALDTETTSRLELSQNGDNGKLINQSDLRVQTMSILLLHYCTGLQHAQKCSDGSPDNSQA